MAGPLLIGVAIVLAFLVVVVATLPAKFRVERSIIIAAPPERAFAEVNDFHRWPGWSPWEKLDPTMKKTFEGAAAGPGSIYSWVGNPKVGQGRMTIEATTPPSLVKLKLEFLKPWKATNATTFSFERDGASTKVTWAMDGERNFVMKAFGIFMDLDKLVGGDFERGLAALKGVAEGAPPAA
jgi:uncharacterized protein YndB with AHSA1/START domain